MMGMRMAETCRAVFKRNAINVKNCYIWLVDSFECMMMHGLANPKFKKRDNVIVVVVVHTMTAYGKAEVQLHRFLMLTATCWSASHFGFFTLRDLSSTTP
jgi:hypothetical protein